MPSSDLERLKKIKAHCNNIRKSLQNIMFEDFKSENGVDTRDVCAFRLFQIGEHAHKLSADIKNKYSGFIWREAYHFRNVLGHDYEGVSFNAIWKSCKNDIPELLSYVEEIIKELEQESDLPNPPNQD